MYRVTKYNPIFRNNKGYYMKEEWTSYHDIKKSRDKESFLEEYLRVEKSYINFILELMKNAKVDSLQLKMVDKHNLDFDEHISKEVRNVYNTIRNNGEISIRDIPYVCILILREYIWAKLENPKLFVHFGYDYYMYVGIDIEYEIDRNSILFIEDFDSPYM